MTPEPETNPDAVKEARRPTQRAVIECSKWLHYCLQIGWSKSLLDDLEALWWKYHDDCGRLIASYSKPLYSAKIGTTASNLIMVYRIRKFRVNQQIKYAAISDVEGMSKGCTPRWSSGRIWKIESNRLFVEKF